MHVLTTMPSCLRRPSLVDKAERLATKRAQEQSYHLHANSEGALVEEPSAEIDEGITRVVKNDNVLIAC